MAVNLPRVREIVMVRVVGIAIFAPAAVQIVEPVVLTDIA